MDHTTRFKTGSLGARLFALTIVPLTALTVLGVQRVSSDREFAAERAEIVDTVSIQRAVADVLPTAQLERFALEGLTRIDELGVPRDIVVAFTGVDLEDTYVPNVTKLESALDALHDAHREIELASGQSLGEELARARRSIEMQRELVAERAGSADDIRAAFDELDAVLDAAVASGSTQLDQQNVGASQVQISLLGEVIESADRYGRSIVAGLVYRTAELRDETLRSLAVHEQALDRFAASLGEADRVAFDELRDGVVRVDLPPVEGGTDGAAERALDPSTVQESAVVALDFLDYLQVLRDFSTQFHDETSAALAAEAAAARSNADRTTLILLGVGSLTLLVAVAIVWSLVVPIRRLTGRARQISHGDLDLPPLPARGPSDVRWMTHAMNQMLTTLHQIDSEISRLAGGQADRRDELHLPGGIGVAIRASFERLETVTDQLQQSQQLSAAIIAEAADAIWTTDVDGLVLTANQASAGLLGIEVDDQIGTRITEYLDHLQGEARVTTPGRADRTVLVARSSVATENGDVNVVIAHDISERTEFEERLAYQAHHDALTGLPNRFAVLDHLARELDGDDQLAVLFIDLDGFKAVNDAEGHAAGDRVLGDIAGTLLASVRGHEFVGRLGGDEFVVVTRRFSQIADVTALGHRLIREIEQPRVSGDRMFVLSASVGIAIAEPGSSALDVIRRADNALYQAKRRGRGQVGLFDATMQEQIESETELEMALRHAVKNDELVLHLQPLVDLDSGKVNGAEALVRWNREGHGMVPPGDFIPIAERSSLIFEIERWVLLRACELTAAWRDRDPECTHRIAVNISGRHLIEGDLVADIDAVLGMTGAHPAMLELELTETQLLEDLDRATEVLDLLRDKGILIAVDDFGTGYSSMTYLRELPIDAIKIDRSFVERATEHGYDSTVIEALLTIGRTLGLSVVAEGIETDAQLDYVRARGCDRAQGFLLARPMPVQDAERILFEPAAESN